MSCDSDVAAGRGGRGKIADSNVNVVGIADTCAGGKSQAGDGDVFARGSFSGRSINDCSTRDKRQCRVATVRFGDGVRNCEVRSVRVADSQEIGSNEIELSVRQFQRIGSRVSRRSKFDCIASVRGSQRHFTGAGIHGSGNVHLVAGQIDVAVV